MTRRLLLLAAVTLALTGCAQLLTGTDNAQDIQTILGALNARGCIYNQTHGEQFLRHTTRILGTWGTPAPDLAECAKLQTAD